MSTGQDRTSRPTGWKICRLPESRWEDHRNLRLQALQNDSIAFGSSYDEEIEYDTSVWKDRMKTALFAVVNDRLVGMISVVRRNRLKTGHTADIFGMYVSREYRQMGIGDALLMSAISVASENKDVTKIVLSVNPKQEAALSLYRKHGFQVAGELKKELQIDGNYYDELVMEKFL